MVVFSDIRDAAERLDGIAVRTPLLEYKALNQHVGARVFIKPEMLQHAACFKFRGAYNCMVQLNQTQRNKGVITYSSGNHAQGIALSAKMLGVRATIIMPADTPTIKIENTKQHGADIQFYDRYTQIREDIVRDIAKTNGQIIIPPYEHKQVIAGQGTIGIEIAQQAEHKGVCLDSLIIPCGGGGLCAGVSTAIKHLSPTTDLFLVEPEAFDDTGRSLRSGRREKIKEGSKSICDAVQTPTPGEITFPINLKNFTGGLTVRDTEVKQAMAYAWKTLKLVLEPTAAMSLACLLSRKVDAQGKNVAIVFSGGNVDQKLFMDCIS